MTARQNARVQMIPIEKINVINPRARGPTKFKQIVANIAQIGLKRPVTVTQRFGADGDTQYDLVCGQGRLEAFQALGQKAVPALIVDAKKEDCLLMSLAENLARRKYNCVEMMKQIGALKERGYALTEIAEKTDLELAFVRGVIRLLKNGEERLLQAVEQGKIPISVAVTIASSDDDEVQRALADAYKNNTLRGKAVLHARQLVEKRRTGGKALRGRRGPRAPRGALSAASILRAYQRETTRQKLILQKARICETRLLFITSALKQLLADESFVNLLRAEKLETIPQQLAERMNGKGT
jgi:ParB family chromosome partitioning protein